MITYFEALNTDKLPKSPYDNNRFEFTTLDIPFFDIHLYFRNYYVLNRQYDIPSKTILPRNSSALRKYLKPTVDFVILDIDDVYDEKHVQQIYDILKDNNFYFFLIPSRSYGRGKYNLKGAVRVKGKNKTINIETFLNNINLLIKGYGKIDLSACREANFQAPTLNDYFFIKHEGEIKELPDIAETTNQNIIIEYDDILKEVIKIAHSKGFSIYKEKDDLLILEHPNEKTKRGYFIFKNNPYVIHHFDKTKSINIYNELMLNERVKELIKNKRVDKVKEFLNNLYIEHDKKIIVNERYLAPKELPEFDILFIKSPMGTGKTNIIKNIIKQNKSKKFLFVTNRRSLSFEILNSYSENNEVSHYLLNEEIKNIHIIQYDSLWKLDLKQFDYIVLDEYISLLLHSFSDLTNKYLQNRMKLYSLLFNNFKLILSDAFLGLEPKFKQWNDRKKLLIENKYRDDITLYQYMNIDALLEDMFEILKNERVTLSINNRKLGALIYEYAKNNGIPTLFFDSYVDEIEKEALIKTFNQENPKWKLLIYTPTITTGVNILANVNKHFHIDDGTSEDTISSLQKMKRVRKTKEIRFYINGIRKNLVLDRNYYEVIFLENSPYVTFDDYGNVSLDRRAHFFIDLEIMRNYLESNHKISFLHLLKEQFKNEPIIVNKKSNFLKSIRKKIQSIQINKSGRFNYNFIYNNPEDEQKIEKLSHLHKQAFYYHLVTKRKILSYYNTIIQQGKTDEIKNVQKLLKYKDIKLKEKFNKNDIKTIGNGFKDFLKMIGYKYDRSWYSYRIDENVKWLAQKLL